MKVARFATVVAQCGAPTVHLVLAKPEQDRALQNAVRTARVMTVFQGVAGTKADSAVVGFEAGAGRQYLIFPRSLKPFTGAKVVGIKYGLLEAPSISKNQRTTSKSRKSGRMPTRHPGAKKSLSDPAELESKVIAFHRVTDHESEADETEAVSELKGLVRRAMKALEDGKQVAAFNLLRRIVEG